MGMKETMQKAAVTAFKVAGNIVTAGVYESSSDDGLSTANTATYYPRILPGEFSVRERSEKNNIQPGDILVTVIFSELPIEPAEGDKVSFGEKGFNVVSYSADAASATKRLHLRGV